MYFHLYLKFSISSVFAHLVCVHYNSITISSACTSVIVSFFLSFYHCFISSPHFLFSSPSLCTISNCMSTVLYQHQGSFSPFIRLFTTQCRSPFLLAFLLLSGDIELNPGPTNFTVCTLNIRSILTDSHSSALSGLIDSPSRSHLHHRNLDQTFHHTYRILLGHP